MKLYNTLTRNADDIEPIHPPTVTVYTCGPTVYDYPHIGNWFTFIRYDILIRTLKANGLKPDWVMNITDVGHLVSDADEGEDKLEKGARREGKTAWDIAKFYGDYFEKGLERLNMLHPDQLPKATDEIPEQIDLIKKLEEKNHTYKTSDGIYFDTSKLDDYGKLARLDIEHLKAGARVEANPEKRNITDFALWKFSPADQKRDMEWDSPWGKGFPGWHLECSAMVIKYLGETIDIHGGGIDHIPVHHTNEIAQSEAATGKPFAHYWFHSNFILVDGKKMSKSLGNFYTLEDIEKKGFDLMAFRLLVLESHYRTEANFSWDALAAAQSRLQSYREFADLVWQMVDEHTIDGEKVTPAIDEATESIKNAINGDLDTPNALAALSKATKQWVKVVAESDKSSLHDFLSFIDDSLGLRLLADTINISQEAQGLLNDRDNAKRKGDYNKADQLKKILEDDHRIGLRDIVGESFWYRIRDKNDIQKNY